MEHQFWFPSNRLSWEKICSNWTITSQRISVSSFAWWRKMPQLSLFLFGVAKPTLKYDELCFTEICSISLELFYYNFYFTFTFCSFNRKINIISRGNRWLNALPPPINMTSEVSTCVPKRQNSYVIASC